MKLALFLLAVLPAFPAVTGTVINRTTGKPQAGATVGLNKLGQQTGIELIDQAKTDAQGKFTIDQAIQGPHVIRTAWDGVTYNHMLPPGSPTTDLALEVYDASTQPGPAKVSKHMLLFEPAAGDLVVSETFLYVNPGKTAWNNDVGTARFFLPSAAGGKAQVNATAPGGMPIRAAILKTADPNIFAVNFPVKPGETRFDVSFSLPYTTGDPYKAKVPTDDDNTYLIAPNGVTLSGENLTDLGQEPRTQARIFGLSGKTYQIQLTGAAAAEPASGGGEESDGRPAIDRIMPRVNSQTTLIIGLALGILALGFALLYRAPAPAPGPKAK